MKLVDAENRKEWDDFVTSHPEANFLQSWDFYEFYKSRGNQIVRRVVWDNDESRMPSVVATLPLLVDQFSIGSVVSSSTSFLPICVGRGISTSVFLCVFAHSWNLARRALI